MKKYKVLKDFLDDQAVLHLEGNEFESVAENYADRVHFWEMLKINHFIKEIPEQLKTTSSGRKMQYYTTTLILELRADIILRRKITNSLQ